VSTGTETVKLTETSYAVLGLVNMCGPATPYTLKQAAQESIFHFWAIPHTQLYTECARLAEARLLDEEREETGRRRRTYSLSKQGRKALDEWCADPEADMYELRDPGLLKLFCGADPAVVAEAQLEKHKQRLERYEQITKLELPEGVRLSLDGGMGHQREYVRFWSKLVKG
jgi:DNA-binding PadR family transcriptional regulator